MSYRACGAMVLNQIQNGLVNFSVALRFLTILPVRFRRDEDGDFFATCLYFFPAVGLVIGILSWLIFSVCSLCFPPMVVAIIIITFLGVISGFLHMDGVADSCDGLLSARPAERSLEIMKDSNTGAMGVVGVVLLLLIKFASLATLDLHAMGYAVWLIPFAGRCSLLIAMGSQRYCRKEGGLGALFYSKRCRYAAVMAVVFLFVISLSVSLKFAFIVTISVLFGVYLLGLFCKKRIGGATGDTLGATCEMCEAITALVFASYYFV